MICHIREKRFYLLLNFIDTITFFFQYQRETITRRKHGRNLSSKPIQDDIELAFSLLKNCLVPKSRRTFHFGKRFSKLASKVPDRSKNRHIFNALDIRKEKRIHPRTLNRYLQELTLFHYLQITGGNKHREGFIYKLSNFSANSQNYKME